MIPVAKPSHLLLGGSPADHARVTDDGLRLGPLALPIRGALTKLPPSGLLLVTVTVREVAALRAHVVAGIDGALIIVGR
jgi:hypothetical protein